MDEKTLKTWGGRKVGTPCLWLCQYFWLKRTLCLMIFLRDGLPDCL